MKNILKIILIFLFSVGLIEMMHSCKEVTIPVVMTQYASDITKTSANAGGYIISDGGTRINERGICWSTIQNPTLESDLLSAEGNDNSYVLTMSDLVPGTTYYVRAYAINSEGISFGNEISFKTRSLLPPSVVTFNASLRTSTTAECGGIILDDDGSSVLEKGVCWNTSHNPTVAGPHTTDGAGIGSYKSTLTSLISNTSYYVRAYATNSAGTGYGNEISITLWLGYPGPQVTDIDGNNYKTVIIGTQLWMAENLKTTTLNDGTAIPNITDNGTWSSINSPSYCWYDNTTSYKTPFGALFNWYAVSTEKLCPTGWHVPSIVEWNILINYLGGGYLAVAKLKEVGTDHWPTPNQGTNESGLNALPSGHREKNGPFIYMNRLAFFWSVTQQAIPKDYEVWALWLSSESINTNPESYSQGNSIRCLKDY